ncbi:hypothetical protein KSP39_PZI008284 [Platanthera zijinensis]|uniref:Uncharacterized protein n=1 Tax=Platanthera zijinensis TaxID=2320716 RepID=A0AAP0BP83_9ASPA
MQIVHTLRFLEANADREYPNAVNPCLKRWFNGCVEEVVRSRGCFWRRMQVVRRGRVILCGGAPWTPFRVAVEARYADTAVACGRRKKDARFHASPVRLAEPVPSGTAAHIRIIHSMRGEVCDGVRFGAISSFSTNDTSPIWWRLGYLHSLFKGELVIRNPISTWPWRDLRNSASSVRSIALQRPRLSFTKLELEFLVSMHYLVIPVQHVPDVNSLLRRAEDYQLGILACS